MELILPLIRHFSKQGGAHEVAVLYRVFYQHHFLRLLPVALPVNKVLRGVGLWPCVAVSVDVGQHCGGYAVPQVCHLLTKWLQLVVSQPFGELGRADLKLGLANALA